MSEYTPKERLLVPETGDERRYRDECDALAASGTMDLNDAFYVAPRRRRQSSSALAWCQRWRAVARAGAAMTQKQRVWLAAQRAMATTPERMLLLDLLPV